jgi:hypothetical protein
MGDRFLKTLSDLRLTSMGAFIALFLCACGSVGVGSGPNALGSGISGGGSESNSPPEISGSPAATVIAGTSYSFTPTASDADNDALTFSITNAPDWASFDPSTGTVAGTPPQGSVGEYTNIEISVSDGQSSVQLPPFSISVLAPLTISGIPNAEIAVGTSYSFQPSTNAPPGSSLAFEILNKPDWASFDPSTGALSGIPSQAGNFPNIVITVSDGTQTASLDAFSISVYTPNGGNHPPSISGQPDTNTRVGMTYSFTPTASDTDGDKLSFSIANRPSWLKFDSTTGTLSGVPNSANLGTYKSIVISVSDGMASASLASFSITVSADLLISGSPQTTVAVGTGYVFQPKTNAPSGTKLTFTIQNAPSWATFNAATGMLSGKPTSGQIGTYSNIVISVSDGVQSSSLPSFSIKVTAALAISGTPATQVTAGTSYAFQPTTNAGGSGTLVFSVQNKPSWATFSTSSGRLSGTPSSTQVGTYSSVVISVTNGVQTSALPAFSIKVVPQTVLSISGTPPPAVNVGSQYSFTPTVSNSGGGSLTFSIQNKPSWATFSVTTGTLAGTPTSASAGTYSNISISVSNGTDQATLPLFSISVNQNSSGTATLDWTAVTLNNNGTPLTNLAGYTVRYGTSSNNLNQVIQVTNPTITTYVISNLTSGTWYFAVNAYTTAGVAGDVSNVGVKTIP